MVPCAKNINSNKVRNFFASLGIQKTKHILANSCDRLHISCSDSVLESTARDSLLSCHIHCRETTECAGFFWNEEKLLCSTIDYQGLAEDNCYNSSYTDCSEDSIPQFHDIKLYKSGISLTNFSKNFKHLSKVVKRANLGTIVQIARQEHFAQRKACVKRFPVPQTDFARKDAAFHNTVQRDISVRMKEGGNVPWDTVVRERD